METTRTHGTESETPITLTPAAAERFQELAEREPNRENLMLRVGVQGGGCGGYQYVLQFDFYAEEDDMVFSSEGVPLVVDEMSLAFLNGARIDFVNELYHVGFKIDNPNATGQCGCGQSFRVDDREGCTA